MLLQGIEKKKNSLFIVTILAFYYDYVIHLHK